jgi:hypothetical protein
MADMETLHADEEMRDDEPDGPELTHNTNDTTTEYGDLEDCVAQCHEARMAHIKNSGLVRGHPPSAFRIGRQPHEFPLSVKVICTLYIPTSQATEELKEIYF